jgi:hypothetical protein
MFERQRIIRLASIGAYFIVSFAVLYWFAGESYFCGRRGFLSTFRLSLACTMWDLFACTAGLFVAQKIMNLRTAAPLLAAAISGTGLASIPFWLFRGYGHYLFEGTAIDVSCFFFEGYGLAFAFVIAPALGLLSLAHGILWLRTYNEQKVFVPE